MNILINNLTKHIFPILVAAVEWKARHIYRMIIMEDINKKLDKRKFEVDVGNYSVYIFCWYLFLLFGHLACFLLIPSSFSYFTISYQSRITPTKSTRSKP